MVCVRERRRVTERERDRGKERIVTRFDAAWAMPEELRKRSVSSAADNPTQTPIPPATPLGVFRPTLGEVVPRVEGNSGYRAGRWRRDCRCTILASSSEDFACCLSTVTSPGKVYYTRSYVCMSSLSGDSMFERALVLFASFFLFGVCFPHGMPRACISSRQSRAG